MVTACGAYCWQREILKDLQISQWQGQEQVQYQSCEITWCDLILSKDAFGWNIMAIFENPGDGSVAMGEASKLWVSINGPIPLSK